jgi:hypothetical protein
MGGAAVALALDGSATSGNGIPGYRCGLAVAPVFPGAPVAGVVVPFGVVGGEGDQVTPYATHAVPYYNALQPATGIKFCYVMDPVCDHMNIVGLGSMQPEVFARTTRIATGFLGRFLDSDTRGLEPVLGVDGVEDPHLSLLMREVVTPQIWSDLEMQSGQSTRISMVAEGGLCGMFAAADLSPWPLPTLIGELLVDPLTLFPTNETVLTVERLDVLIEVPDLTSLIGASFALQAVGATIEHPCRLGSAIRFEVAAP